MLLTQKAEEATLRFMLDLLLVPAYVLLACLVPLVIDGRWT